MDAVPETQNENDNVNGERNIYIIFTFHSVNVNELK